MVKQRNTSTGTNNILSWRFRTVGELSFIRRTHSRTKFQPRKFPTRIRQITGIQNFISIFIGCCRRVIRFQRSFAVFHNQTVIPFEFIFGKFQNGIKHTLDIILAGGVQRSHRRILIFCGILYLGFRPIQPNSAHRQFQILIIMRHTKQRFNRISTRNRRHSQTQQQNNRNFFKHRITLLYVKHHFDRRTANQPRVWRW